jgi:hypothetical protein
MNDRHRLRPSPALAIACLALFVALGGTVLAATKIDGKTIRVKSLPGNRLAVGTLPGNRIVPGTLKGAQIDVGSLGQVPNATHANAADTAHRAQTAAAADHAGDASTVNGRSVGCPEQTREFAGACWDLTTGPTAVTAPEAVAACAARGGELPQPLSLLSIAEQPGVTLVSSGEWLNELWIGNEVDYSLYILDSDHHFRLRPPQELHRFRCVTPLLH